MRQWTYVRHSPPRGVHGIYRTEHGAVYAQNGMWRCMAYVNGGWHTWEMWPAANLGQAKRSVERVLTGPSMPGDEQDSARWGAGGGHGTRQC